MKHTLPVDSTRYVLLVVVIFVTVFLYSIKGVWAADFCVTNATELQARLGDAENNGQDDTIQIARGTYNGNFTFISSEGHSITLLGGYNTDCTTRIINPKDTILDAQNSGRVLYLYDSAGGSITVDGLTIRNGGGISGAGIYARSDKDIGDIGDIILTNNLITGNITGEGDYYGGGVRIYSKANSGKSANIILTDNTIRGNTAHRVGGGVYITTMSYPSGDSGEITFNNNIVAGNTVTVYDGGGADINSSAYEEGSYTCGDVNFCNNTFTGNASGRYGGGVSLSVDSGTVRVYNNIIRDNSATLHGNDIHLFSSGSPNWNGYNNDYSDMFGCSWTNSGNNIDQDPLFVSLSGGNYRIKGNSPCINAGIYGKKIYIPATMMWVVYNYSFIPADDFEGDSRDSDWIEVTTNNYYKYCDIGADEYTPTFLPCVPLLLLSN